MRKSTVTWRSSGGRRGRLDAAYATMTRAVSSHPGESVRWETKWEDFNVQVLKNYSEGIGWGTVEWYEGIEKSFGAINLLRESLLTMHFGFLASLETLLNQSHSPCLLNSWILSKIVVLFSHQTTSPSNHKLPYSSNLVWICTIQLLVNEFLLNWPQICCRFLCLNINP